MDSNLVTREDRGSTHDSLWEEARGIFNQGLSGSKRSKVDDTTRLEDTIKTLKLAQSRVLNEYGTHTLRVGSKDIDINVGRITRRLELIPSGLGRRYDQVGNARGLRLLEVSRVGRGPTDLSVRASGQMRVTSCDLDEGNDSSNKVWIYARTVETLDVLFTVLVWTIYASIMCLLLSRVWLMLYLKHSLEISSLQLPALYVHGKDNRIVPNS